MADPHVKMPVMPFTFHKCDIPEVILIKAVTFGDERGFFRETFKASDFVGFGIDGPFIQENFSHSKKGILRGLHFQKLPYAQGKLVSALNGKIRDVAVDIRKGSPHYGKWVSEVLSRENGHQLYVPPGFAHGFVVLSDEADVLYKVNGGEYAPEHEAGIMWNDPEIAVKWEIDSPLLSAKDEKLPSLSELDNCFTYSNP